MTRPAAQTEGSAAPGQAMDMAAVVRMMEADLAAVERQFERNLDSRVPLIQTVGRYVLTSGGKRIRPLLLLLSARLCGYRGERSVPLASIVEFIHTATLLHDDVVDDADLRRGQKSANTVWGNEATVLVGDFLFSKSFSLMVGDGDLRVLRAMADATTALAEGEILELLKTCDLDVTVEEYLDVIRNKTAVLIAAACEVGALLGAVDEERVAALKGYGMDVGIAFQLVDDCLDFVGDRERFGKPVGADLEEGKITLPVIHALGAATDEERDRVARLVEQDAFSDDDRAWVREFVVRRGGIDAALAMARDRVEQAKARLAAFPACPEREALGVVADYVVARDR